MKLCDRKIFLDALESQEANMSVTQSVIQSGAFPTFGLMNQIRQMMQIGQMRQMKQMRQIKQMRKIRHMRHMRQLRQSIQMR